MLCFFSVCYWYSCFGSNIPEAFKNEEAYGKVREENSGKCGDNLDWVFDAETSTLSITGNGNMTCCGSVNTPWSQFQNVTKTVEIEGGVTSIDSLAFRLFRELSSVIIPDSVTSIGNYSFYNCTSLQSLVIPESVKSLGGYCFFGCSS